MTIISYCRELNHDLSPVNEQKWAEKALRMRNEPQSVSRIKTEEVSRMMGRGAGLEKHRCLFVCFPWEFPAAFPSL